MRRAPPRACELNAVGRKAKADALKALYAAWSAKDAGQRVRRDVQVFLDANTPGSTTDDRVLAAQGDGPAREAVAVADKVVRVVGGRLSYKR